MSEFVQYILSGLSLGCIYALVALGIVVIANVTGVFNFAQGDYVMVGGMIMAATATAGWGIPLGIVTAVVAVALVALLQERLTVAPVRGKIGPLGLLIASLGFGALLRGIALAIWDEDPRRAPPFSDGIFEVLGARLTNQTLWVWVVTALCLVAVVLLFRRTDIGRAMRASALNPLAARLHGIRIGSTSMGAFVLAGALAGLVAAVTVSITQARWDSGLEITLVAFIAAAIAGFSNPTRAVVAGLALGVVETTAAGAISSEYRDAIVYGTLLVYLLGRDLAGREGVLTRLIKARGSTAERDPRIGEIGVAIRERTEEFVRGLGAKPRTPRGPLAGLSAASILPVALLGLAALLPLLTDDAGFLDAAVFIVLGAIGATGFGLILGLAGQLSLGHPVFYIVSGYAVAILTVNEGWAAWPAIGVGIAASITLAYLLGRLTVRLRGFNLALATLAVQLTALVYVSQQYDQGITGLPILSIFGTEFIEADQFLWLSLGVLAICLLVARNVWQSQTGLALRSVGIDEEAAESLGLDAAKLKLRVLLLGAGMAAVAGVLWVFYLNFAASTSWNVAFTIDLLTFVIVGGLASPFGAALGAAVVGGLQYFVREGVTASDIGSGSTQYEIMLTGALLIFFVLAFRTGLVSLPRSLANLYRRRRYGPGEDEEAAEPDAATPAPDDLPDDAGMAAGDGAGQHERVALARVDDLGKQFGSLDAVKGVDFELHTGEITAMIGPNGAGKSTVINMLSGTLVPTTGDIAVMGHPVVGMRPTEIGQAGVGRTFQTPRLYEGLTTLENVVLARQRFRSSGLLEAAILSPRSRREEADAETEALTWLDFVGLREDADQIATSLPVGKQRLAELARALATDPSVLLLDEPAAGLDGTETKTLAKAIRTIRSLDLAVLLVEHDMAMVMAIADSVLVLEEGQKISEGLPEQVGADPVVVEAYLGVAHES